MNPDTTPTPRMDALYQNGNIIEEDIDDLCRELERELTDKTNEVERLREELAKAMSMIDRDMQCEAEVARLKELLNRAIEIAKTLSGGGSRACRELHHSKKDRHELGEVCPVEEKIENADHNWVTLRQVKDREFEDQALPVSLALQYDMPESIREKIAGRKEGK